MGLAMAYIYTARMRSGIDTAIKCRASIDSSHEFSQAPRMALEDLKGLQKGCLYSDDNPGNLLPLLL